MNCIETKNLTHRFSENQTVLNNISLQIPTGSIYGFLGPNGAGKTTTLRLMLGLLKKQEGTISVFNKSVDKHRIEILRNTGSLIESPSLYTHLTATENLAILQKIYQCPKSRIREVLEMVDLSETGNKKVRAFSLGMKQRLSIAVALLHSPSLLILDEPTNGLDPNGIIEMRALIKKLNTDNKMTILISSHLLSEIEKIVTHIGIIHKGSVLFQGTLPELHIKQTLGSVTRFDTNHITRAMNIISENGLQPLLTDGILTAAIAEKEVISTLNRQFVEQGIDVYQISTLQNDLESIFMDLIKN